MKYTAVILLASGAWFLMLQSCVTKNKNEQPEWPKYSLVVESYVPDSVISEQAKFVTETCRAATNNLKTDDYEDVDDLVEEATHSANRLFTVEIRALQIQTTNETKTILPHLLTKREKVVYDSLMTK